MAFLVNGRNVTKEVFEAAQRKIPLIARGFIPLATALPNLVLPGSKSVPPQLRPKAPAKKVIPTKIPETKGTVAVDNFLAELNLDGHALPSRYEVVIAPPTGLRVRLNDIRTVSMRVEAIDLPGRALNTSLDTNMYGIAPEIVDGITFGGTIALTVQETSNLKEREFFQSWQELAWNKETWNVNYYKNYIGSMDFYILDINNNRRYGVKIFECFPKEVGAVALSYNQATEIIKTSVTMQYKYWETLPSARKTAVSANINDQGATRVQSQNKPKAISALQTISGANYELDE